MYNRWSIFTFIKNIFKLNNHCKTSIVKNAFFAKKEKRCNPNLYLLSFSNNVKAGETHTSAEQLWLMLQNGTYFDSYFAKVWFKTNSLGHFPVKACWKYFFIYNWNKMRNTHALCMKDWKFLNNLVFKYPIASRHKAILVITRKSCSIKVILLYYAHLILLALEDFLWVHIPLNRVANTQMLISPRKFTNR